MKNNTFLMGLATVISLWSGSSNADTLDDFVSETVSALASNATGVGVASFNENIVGGEDKSFAEVASSTAMDGLITETVKLFIRGMVRSYPQLIVNLDEPALISRAVARSKTSLSRIDGPFIRGLAIDIAVGATIDVASEVARETNGGAGTVGGEYSYYLGQQLKVAYAWRRGGLYGATLEAGAVTTGQVLSAYHAAVEAGDAQTQANISTAVANATSNAALLRSSYMRASPSQKTVILNQIRSNLRDDLTYLQNPNTIVAVGNLLGVTDRPARIRQEVPGAEVIVQAIVQSIQEADNAKYTTLAAYLSSVQNASTPSELEVRRQAVEVFVRRNFQGGVTGTGIPVGEASDLLNQIEGISTGRLSVLQPPSEIVSNSDERIIWVEGLEFDEAPIVISDPNTSTVNDEINTPTETGFVVTENSEGEPVIGNNAGTNIEIQTEPTGPTPEEIEEAERLAEEERLTEIAEAERRAALRLQQIADLEVARDSLSITQQDAQARLQERRNRLTVLQFNELEKVTEASGLVRERIQELRIEQGDTGLSASDQQLLLDLVAYEDRLQTEQERIARDTTAAQNAISQYEASLAQVETQLDTNAASLEGPDYSIVSDYIVPNFTPEGLTDWTNYEYELPAFDPAELLTSDLSNVVGHAVSVPVAGGNSRVDIDLVAEDNTILDIGIPGAITEIENENSEFANGSNGSFNHVYFGRGIDENGNGSQWIYGEAATPEQFALRTGSAIFNGSLGGYYAHGSVSDHTLYDDGVDGAITLEVDFETNRLTGEGEIEIDTAVRNETLAFSLNETTISETDSGLTRSLGFNASATLENERGARGNLGGTFYGEDASEAAGSFAFDLGAGFSAGLWVAGEGYEFQEDDSNETGNRGNRIFAVGYSATNNSYGTAWSESENIYGDAFDITSTLSSDGYDHVSWGTWDANSETHAPFDESNPGNWIDVENVTTSAALQNRTGSAQFGGEILGGYVSHGNVEEDAQGIINITTYFSDQDVEGEYQFGHSCGSSGLSSCNVVSSVYSFEERVNDYGGSGFGDHSGTSDTGVVGIFGGENGQEIGGVTWLFEDHGHYLGVFRAKEGLSFGGFVAPRNANELQESSYSDWIGVASYSFNVNNANGTHSHADLEFASIEGVDVDDYIIIEETTPSDGNTRLGGNPVGDRDYIDTNNNNYDHLAWGQWGSINHEGGTVVTNGVTVSSGNWLIIDQTTNLPTSGSASYSGDLAGQLVNSADSFIGGSIQIEADFASDRVTGDISIDTRDIFTNQINEGWAVATFDTTISRDTEGSGFQGALTGSDVNSGVIFGGFAGPNAEEVGGGWQIDHVDGSNANGIFRAQN